MKKRLLCLVGISFYFTQMFCQYYFYDANHLEPEWRWEAGVSAGLMNCLTDLGGHKGNGKKFLKDVNWKTSGACGGLFLAVTRRDVIAWRIESTWGMIRASDSILKNDQTAASLRYLRNLHFRSRLMEINSLIEFHPLLINRSKIPSCSPYLLLGIGYFHFEPEANLNGNWVKLQPLHTEGQGFKEFPERPEYKLHQLNIPLGFGLKYDASRFLMIRLEFLYRILSTDYLDDVSKQYVDPSLFFRYFPLEKAALAERLADRTGELDPGHHTVAGTIRGNPQNKDAYFSTNLKVSVVLNRKRF